MQHGFSRSPSPFSYFLRITCLVSFSRIWGRFFLQCNVVVSSLRSINTAKMGICNHFYPHVRSMVFYGDRRSAYVIHGVYRTSIENRRSHLYIMARGNTSIKEMAAHILLYPGHC